MTISTLLMGLVEALVSTVGTKILGALLRSVLDLVPGHVAIAAAGGVSDVPASALAAPQELKDYTVQLLQKLVNSGNLPLYARMILNQVIKLLPEIEDSLWNTFFGKGLVTFSVPVRMRTTSVIEEIPSELLECCKM